MRPSLFYVKVAILILKIDFLQELLVQKLPTSHFLGSYL